MYETELVRCDWCGVAFKLCHLRHHVQLRHPEMPEMKYTPPTPTFDVTRLILSLFWTQIIRQSACTAAPSKKNRQWYCPGRLLRRQRQAPQMISSTIIWSVKSSWPMICLTWAVLTTEGEKTGGISDDDNEHNDANWWQRKQQTCEEGKRRAKFDLLLEEGEPRRHLWPVRQRRGGGSLG